VHALLNICPKWLLADDISLLCSAFAACRCSVSAALVVILMLLPAGPPSAQILHCLLLCACGPRARAQHLLRTVLPHLASKGSAQHHSCRSVHLEHTRT
jgi:hypothetical protein